MSSIQMDTMIGDCKVNVQSHKAQRDEDSNLHYSKESTCKEPFVSKPSETFELNTKHDFSIFEKKTIS